MRQTQDLQIDPIGLQFKPVNEGEFKDYEIPQKRNTGNVSFNLTANPTTVHTREITKESKHSSESVQSLGSNADEVGLTNPFRDNLVYTGPKSRNKAKEVGGA